MQITLSLSDMLTCSKRASKLTKRENVCGGVRGEGEREHEDGDTRRRLVLMFHYWHSFRSLRFSHSAGRQTGTRVA